MSGPKFLFSILLSMSMMGRADEMSVDDRLYDLEAQIETLKVEVNAAKAQSMQEKANAFNPSISVVGDVVGQYGFGSSNQKSHEHLSFTNGVLVREVELELRGEVDPFADALIALGVGAHGDHVHLDVEEAYARLKSIPALGYSPLGMIIKAGRFKPAIGRLNRIHLHNAPQIYYPASMRAFLGDEGFSSQGLSLNIGLNPTPKSALNLFLEGLFSSRLAIQDKGAEKMPSGVAHLWWHQELFSSHFLDIGISGLFGRKGKVDSGLFCLIASDIHYSFLPPGYGQDPLFLLGSEFYTANIFYAGHWPIGTFTWAQARIFNGMFFGLLYDLAFKKEVSQLQQSFGAFLTYYTSEFLRFRLGYEHVMPSINALKGDDRLMLSMIFILGSHPVEPYFINR